MSVLVGICALVGFLVLVSLALQALTWCAQRLWRWGKRRRSAWVGWLRTTGEYLGLVEEEGEFERLLREQIAADFDRLAGNRDPANPIASRRWSDFCTQAADRVRHPERYSGVAQAASNDGGSHVANG